MILLLMGVSGSGKTTLGRLLAARLGWPYYDADDFHPAENIAKMRRGEPLTDEDRAPWLARLRALIETRQREGGSAVVSCSALKAAYRQTLQQGDEDIRLVHLAGDPELLRERLQRRAGHFFTPALLESQLAALEPPEGVLTLDVGESPEALAERVLARFDLAD